MIIIIIRINVQGFTMNKKSTTVKLLTTTLALSAIFSSHLYAEESAHTAATTYKLLAIHSKLSKDHI